MKVVVWPGEIEMGEEKKRKEKEESQVNFSYFGKMKV